MGLKNKIFSGNLYFVTMTVEDWVDIFTRPVYKKIIVDSIKHCQKEKGLEVYAWCLMTNHLHMIISNKDGKVLTDIIRDFKKFTSKEILRAIQSENESRRDWMLNRFEYAGLNDKKIKNYKFWQEGNEAKEIISPEFMMQKLYYIHENPVKEEIVEESWEYLYSSARDYCERSKGLIDIIFIE